MLRITELTVNHRDCLFSLDETPVFSWVLESDKRNVVQTAYTLTIGGYTQQGAGQSNAVVYEGPALPEETRFEVHLSVTDNYGQRAEADTFFTTAPESLHAKWITADEEVPVFFHRFWAPHIRSAMLYVSACGVYEARLNGQRVSEDLLSPGWTNYRKRIQYQTYDVTSLLQEENRLEMTVAPGWWAGYLNGEGKNHFYGDAVAAFAELHLVDVRGQKTVICSDENWFYTTGEVRFAELYHGETIDRTAEPAQTKPVRIYEGMDNSRLVPQAAPCVRVTERKPPISLIHTPKGETVLDFGQNLSGVVELSVCGERGRKIVLRHAEVLDQDGNFYTTNLRTVRATDTFICSGKPEVFRPKFTFHGFRYVSVEGMGEHPDLSAFTACVMHSDLKETASFACSKPLVNRLWENINWSMRDNFVDIPSDCPQRDERLGWTGDAAIFADTASQLRDTYAFYRKWLADLASEQSVRFGLPDTVPNILMPPETPCGGSAVWGDACTLVPWAVYLHSGDPAVLRAQYESMKAWVEWMRRTETPDHLHKAGYQRGDWLAMDREEGKGMSGSTDVYLISTAFYYESTWILAESARILGYEEDDREYHTLAEQIREGFRSEYITAKGRCVTETQTALSLILCFGLAKPEHVPVLVDTLANHLSKRNNRITTGFIGTPYLVKALSLYGRHDLAGKLLLNEAFPGWLNEVKLGATTIWERWDSMHADGTFDESGMNSFNHYSFGAIGSWMIGELGGIRPAEPGYGRIHFEPRLTEGLTEVSVFRKTPFGPASCRCTCHQGHVTVDVTVPVNTQAVLVLPVTGEEKLLGSGLWSYVYDTDFRCEPRKYTMDSTIEELSANPAFAEALNNRIPGAADQLHMEFMQKMTLNALASMGGEEIRKVYLAVLEELNRAEE